MAFSSSRALVGGITAAALKVWRCFSGWKTVVIDGRVANGFEGILATAVIRDGITASAPTLHAEVETVIARRIISAFGMVIGITGHTSGDALGPLATAYGGQARGIASIKSGLIGSARNTSVINALGSIGESAAIESGRALDPGL